MLNTSTIEARTAARLRVAADDPELTSAVAAAIAYVSTWTGVAVDDLPDTDPLVEVGAVLLAVRMYQDTGVPSRSLDAYGDVTLTGAVIPEQLDRHLSEYFGHITCAWGTA